MSQISQSNISGKTKRYRAHFDGKVVVLDEPANLAPGVAVYVEDQSSVRENETDIVEGELNKLASPEERVAAFREMLDSMRPYAGAHVDPALWTRSSFYEDD